MDDVTLWWDKPMTSEQAAKHHLTGGFVAVELYRAANAARVKAVETLAAVMDQLDAAHKRRRRAEAMLREACVFMTCEWGEVCGQNGWACDKCSWLSRYRAEYWTQAAAQGGEGE